MTMKNKYHLQTIGLVGAVLLFLGLQIWSALGPAIALRLERLAVEKRAAKYQTTIAKLTARRLPLPSLPENTFANAAPSEQILSFQARLGVLARQSKLNLDLMRAEQSNSFSPGTQTVPVTIRAKGDLLAFTDFMKSLEREQPSVFVDYIQIIPTGRDHPDARIIVQMHLLRLVKEKAAS